METTWVNVRRFIDQKDANIDYVDLIDRIYIVAWSGKIELRCTILKRTPEETLFESTYKSKAWTFLRKDKLDLVLFKGEITTDVLGVGEADFKIPGTVGQLNGRFIEYGRGWFTTPQPGDHLTKLDIVDVDGIIPESMRPPSYPIVGSYMDYEAAVSNQGAWITERASSVTFEAITGYGVLMSGLYLRIGVKRGVAGIDKFRFNVKWGKPTI